MLPHQPSLDLFQEIEKTLARSCTKTQLWRLQSSDSRLHPATYCIRRVAGTSGRTSPTVVWFLHRHRTRRRAIVELLGSAQGELLWPFRSIWSVAERRPVRTSRDVTSGRSSRPWHRKVLYFPHCRLWIMEYSCKERADVWWASLLRTWFEDGAIDVAWD
ncbi:hypothetical protein Taro_000481 [Colocasia esculenta]|uniref:Uncharacterized protein n=1 Tax=Colocasia esculenta TaxID=4460 RepID=A0A843T788_COLES|nr:hypothetical protein [Colocasia esculenta]